MLHIISRHEAKFIKIIAEQIKIYSNVEIDSRLQDLSSSLREELTDDVHMIGIRGLKGTGKTTNGKSTYGKSYHGSQSKDSFLENVITVKQNEGVLSEKQNEGRCEFNTADSVLEITVKGASKQCIEIPVSEVLAIAFFSSVNCIHCECNSVLLRNYKFSYIGFC